MQDDDAGASAETDCKAGSFENRAGHLAAAERKNAQNNRKQGKDKHRRSGLHSP
jgi:hypothetical protein